MGESCPENWHERVEVRKNEISNKVKEIFGHKDAVILVPYSGRVRMSFPCLKHECSFFFCRYKKISNGKTNGTKKNPGSKHHTTTQFLTL